MGRVFFPTYSLNRFGVRDTDQRATLGAVQRFDSEPSARASNAPTPSMLGAVIDFRKAEPVEFRRDAREGGGIVYARPYPLPGPMPSPPILYRPPVDGRPQNWFPPIYPAPRPMPPTPGPVSSSGGGGAVQQVPTTTTPPPNTLPVTSAPPVSTQVGPTPTVTTPPPAPNPQPILVSSGGGTQTPSTPTVISAPAPRGFVDGIAAWLGGSTPIFNYNVPNALLAGAVVLTFALIESSGGATPARRR